MQDNKKEQERAEPRKMIWNAATDLVHAGGVVLMRGYKDYLNGYTDDKGEYHKGYTDLVFELQSNFPLTEESVAGEERQKQFIRLFGALVWRRQSTKKIKSYR